MAIYDDLEHARNFMRPYLALYIGGMGAREKNFYSKLVTRYGYGDAAAGDPGPVPRRASRPRRWRRSPTT